MYAATMKARLADGSADAPKAKVKAPGGRAAPDVKVPGPEGEGTSTSG
jgi:hypothetical protein